MVNNNKGPDVSTISIEKLQRTPTLVTPQKYCCRTSPLRDTRETVYLSSCGEYVPEG